MTIQVFFEHGRHSTPADLSSTPRIGDLVRIRGFGSFRVSDVEWEIDPDHKISPRVRVHL